MRVFIAGATGTAGLAAVRQAVHDPKVTKVTALARRPLPLQHRKLNTLIAHNFIDYSLRYDELAGHDAALWCLGTSQSKVSSADLQRITVDYTVAGAKALRATNPAIQFVHLSGARADPTLGKKTPYRRAKGEAEKRLDDLGLPGLWHFRPAYIHPTERREKPKVAERLLWRVAPILRRLAPQTLIDADELAKAMLTVARNGHEKRVLENRDIRRVADATPGN